MTRLFIAIPIELSAEAREVYSSLAALDLMVRMPSLENLHLTLRFIGEVPNALIEPIGDTLAELHDEYRFPSRCMQFESVSRFPTSRRKPARVVFLTLDEASEHYILEVSEKITSALEEMSPSIERLDRNVVPHLTLARIKDQHKAEKKVEEIIHRFSDRDLGEVQANRIELIASSLTGAGAFYTTKHEIELVSPHRS
ncbi:2',5' RNA ligase family [Poriferisphaera corsica]|uniref:RNA 2',3'-cyclic phosphodiesterase n=1 Tax=Poriferisphaera corsica TaxID=2528020 RepID=A0A517YYR7_9BACT|nr:RNA 2',3'-cyclic phosphodiesterase [Poriferisphaera corsica]QDU35373.1 2',5' RNA ligase family [Poriferisphaera corsica]